MLYDISLVTVLCLTGKKEERVREKKEKKNVYIEEMGHGRVTGITDGRK